MLTNPTPHTITEIVGECSVRHTNQEFYEKWRKSLLCKDLLMFCRIKWWVQVHVYSIVGLIFLMFQKTLDMSDDSQRVEE
jgi:hypothetical protein